MKTNELKNKPAIPKRSRLSSAMDSLSQRPLFISYLAGLTMALLVCFYLPYNYLIAPAKARNDETRKTIGEKKARNDAADRIRSNDKAFNQDFVDLYKITQVAHLLLPPKAEATKVLEGVQVIAQNSNLKVVRFSAARPPVASGRLFEITVTTQFTGKHRDIATFLARLADHERIINITAFNLMNAGPEQTLSLDLATYYAPPPKDLPPFPEDIIRLAESGR
jgi:Tfp pilus assembly protein PilO